MSTIKQKNRGIAPVGFLVVLLVVVISTSTVLTLNKGKEYIVVEEYKSNYVDCSGQSTLNFRQECIRVCDSLSSIDEKSFCYLSCSNAPDLSPRDLCINNY